MIRKILVEKNLRRCSYPPSLKAMGKSYTAALLSPAKTLPQSVATESIKKRYCKSICNKF
jgi:hypothetical protein